MKYFLPFILVFFIRPAFGTDLYYYVGYERDSEKAITCDNFVRSYADQFNEDLLALITTYQNHEYSKSANILVKYGITEDYDKFLKNSFVSSVFSCSAIYRFSGDTNYYRKLMTDMMYLYSNIGYTVYGGLPYEKTMPNVYNNIVKHLDTVMKSINKTANKSLNTDAQ